MNTMRAKEIAASAKMANVTYLDKQIYIQHVDDQTNTARVFPLNEPQHEFEVNVDNLIEH